jgi:DNA-binding MarR family transcriptional regulator
VIRAADLRSRQLVKMSGLTAPQLLVLQSIRNKGSVSSGELARDISVSQATVTTILDRLEKKAFVVRQRSEKDKRKVMVSLTAAGSASLEAAPQPLQENFVRQFQALQQWEQTQIIASLQRVVQMMGAQHIDASPVLDVGALDRTERPL